MHRHISHDFGGDQRPTTAATLPEKTHLIIMCVRNYCPSLFSLSPSKYSRVALFFPSPLLLSLRMAKIAIDRMNILRFNSIHCWCCAAHKLYSNNKSDSWNHPGLSLCKCTCARSVARTSWLPVSVTIVADFRHRCRRCPLMAEICGRTSKYECDTSTHPHHNRTMNYFAVLDITYRPPHAFTLFPIVGNYYLFYLFRAVLFDVVLCLPRLR